MINILMLHNLRMSKKALVQDFLSTPNSRLRYVRSLVSFNNSVIRKELDSIKMNLISSKNTVFERLQIPEITIRKWESGTRRLTESGLKKCVNAYANLGIIVSEEWLKSGTGSLPAIRESGLDEDYIRAMHDNSSIFFSYLNKEGRFLYISKRYSKLFDLPSQSILGAKLSDLIKKKSYETQKPYLEKAFNGEEVKFAYPWEYKPGSFRMLKLHFIPDFDSKKNVKGIFSFLEELDNNTNLPQKIDSLEYDEELYIKIVKFAKSFLESENLKYDFTVITKLAEDLYASTKAKAFYKKH